MTLRDWIWKGSALWRFGWLKKGPTVTLDIEAGGILPPVNTFIDACGPRRPIMTHGLTYYCDSPACQRCHGTQYEHSKSELVDYPSTSIVGSGRFCSPPVLGAPYGGSTPASKDGLWGYPYREFANQMRTLNSLRSKVALERGTAIHDELDAQLGNYAWGARPSKAIIAGAWKAGLHSRIPVSAPYWVVNDWAGERSRGHYSVFARMSGHPAGFLWLVAESKDSRLRSYGFQEHTLAVGDRTLMWLGELRAKTLEAAIEQALDKKLNPTGHAELRFFGEPRVSVTPKIPAKTPLQKPDTSWMGALLSSKVEDQGSHSSAHILPGIRVMWSKDSTPEELSNFRMRLLDTQWRMWYEQEERRVTSQRFQRMRELQSRHAPPPDPMRERDGYVPVSFKFEISAPAPRVSREVWQALATKLPGEIFPGAAISVLELEQLAERLKDGWDGTEPIQ